MRKSLYSPNNSVIFTFTIIIIITFIIFLSIFSIFSSHPSISCLVFLSSAYFVFRFNQVFALSVICSSNYMLCSPENLYSSIIYIMCLILFCIMLCIIIYSQNLPHRFYFFRVGYFLHLFFIDYIVTVFF